MTDILTAIIAVLIVILLMVLWSYMNCLDKYEETKDELEAAKNLLEAFQTASRFKYPEIKFVEENNLWEQLDHIKSEITEIEQAQTDAELWEELCDAEHAIETAIRIEQNAGMDVDYYRAKVIEKNRGRDGNRYGDNQ